MQCPNDSFLELRFRYYVLRDDMLAYYISDLTERLPNKNETGSLEVSVTTHICASAQFLCRDRRSKQHFIASCLYRKLSPWSLTNIYRSFSVQIFLVNCRHPGIIAYSAPCSGLSVRLLRLDISRFCSFLLEKTRFLRLVVHNPSYGIK